MRQYLPSKKKLLRFLIFFFIGFIVWTAPVQAVFQDTAPANGTGTVVIRSPEPQQARIKDVSVTIEWLYGESPHPTVRVKLLRIDSIGKAEELGSAVIDDGVDSYIWSNLPVYDRFGGEYVYYPVNDGADPEGYRAQTDGLTLTYVSSVPTATFIGYIQWEGGDRYVRPATALQLMRNGLPFGPLKHVSEAPAGTPQSSVFWTDIPVADEDGERYVYTIMQPFTPAGYAKKEDKMIVRNVYLEELTSVTGTVEWVNGAAPRPSTFVKLFRSDADGTLEEVSGATFSNGITSYTWEKLHKYDPQGNPYSYHLVSELPPENYLPTANGLTLTFEYQPKKIRVSADVKWQGGGMIGYRPETTVLLLQDGQPFGEAKTVPASKSMNLSETEVFWEDVPETDLDGTAYRYTVTEPVVPAGYAKTESDLVITNRFIPNTIQVSGRVTWVNGRLKRNPARIALMRVIGDGRAEQVPVRDLSDASSGLGECAAMNPILLTPGRSPELADEASEVATWCVAETDFDGNRYDYFIAEIADRSDAAASAASSDWQYDSTEPSLHLRKQFTVKPVDPAFMISWAGGENYPHPSIQLELRRNGERIGEPFTYSQEGVTGAGTTAPIHVSSLTNDPDLTDLPESDLSGQEYTYTIHLAEPIPNFVSTVSGMAILNTFKSEAIAIHAEHTWLNGNRLRKPVSLVLTRRISPASDQAEFVVPDPEIRIDGETCAMANPIQLYPEEADQALDQTAQQITWCVEAYDRSGRKNEFSLANLNEEPTENWRFEIPDPGKPFHAVSRFEPGMVSPGREIRWIGGAKLPRPEFSLDLYRGETKIDSITVAAAERPVSDSVIQVDWCGLKDAAELCELPDSDPSGEPIQYSILPAGNPDRYLASETEEAITYRYLSPKTEIVGTVDWVNGQPERESVEVLLMRRRGTETEPVAILAEDRLDGAECVDANPVRLTPTDSPDDPDVLSRSAVWCVDETDGEGNAIDYFIRLTDDDQLRWRTLPDSASNLKLIRTFLPVQREIRFAVEWIGGETLPRPSMNVALLRDGTRWCESVVIPALTDSAPIQTYSFEALMSRYQRCEIPKTDEHGVPYTYSLEVVSAPEQYLSTADGLRIKNVYQPAKKEVAGAVRWLNGQQMRDPVRIALMRLDEDGSVHQVALTDADRIPGKNCAEENPILLTPPAAQPLQAQAEVSVRWCVDETAQNGSQISYFISELRDEADGTLNAPYWKTAEDPDSRLRLIKTFQPPVVDPEIQLRWIGGEKTERPEITLDLRREGTSLGRIYKIPAQAAGAANRSTYALSALDISSGQTVPLAKTDARGENYEYTIHPVGKIPNYSVVEDGLTLTLTYRSEQIPVRAEVTRRNGEHSPRGVTLQLTQLSENGAQVEIPATALGQLEDQNCSLMNPVAIPAEAFSTLVPTVTKTVTWCVDRTDSEGNPYQYAVVPIVAEHELWNIEMDPENPLHVVDTYRSRMIRPSFRLNWQGGSLLSRPPVDVQLLQNGVRIDEMTVTQESASQTGLSTIAFNWDEVPETDESGLPYRYSIVQKAAPKYYQQIDATATSITNRYTPRSVDISGEIAWQNGPKERPTVSVQLWRKVADGDFEMVDTAAIWDGSTRHVWRHQPMTDSEGRLYFYSIRNAYPVKDYQADEEGLTVTYVYKPQLGDVQATIKWVRGSRLTRPATELQLMRNGRAVGEIRTIEAVETTGVMDQVVSWTNLPMNDEQGIPYVYTVTQPVTPENYFKSESGLTVTNTYVSPKIGLVGEISWEGKTGPRPTVKVTLARSIPNGDPVAIDTVEIPDGKLNYAWRNQPLADEEGNPYTYSLLNAEPLINYTATTDGMNLKYQYQPALYQQDGIIEAKVVWVGVPEPHPTVSVMLRRSLNEAAANLETVDFPDGKTTHQWTDLIAMTDDGAAYEYSIVVHALPEEYLIEIDGFTVTIRYQFRAAEQRYKF